LIQGVLLVVAALFPIVNPLGNAPFFLALTADQPTAVRSALARRVALNGFILLLAAIFLGDFILDSFGVSVPAVQIAGGLLVTSLSWRLLGDSAVASNPAPGAEESASALGAKAFYPLTLPLTVGPGTISVAITLGANFPSTVQPFLADAASAVIGAFIVCMTTLVCFSHAERLTRMLGPVGLTVVMRLSAFILLCIGVQIVLNGADALFGLSRTMPAVAP